MTHPCYKYKNVRARIKAYLLRPRITWASSKQISKALGVPQRSICYYLSKMKDNIKRSVKLLDPRVPVYAYVEDN